MRRVGWELASLWCCVRESRWSGQSVCEIYDIRDFTTAHDKCDLTRKRTEGEVAAGVSTGRTTGERSIRRRYLDLDLSAWAVNMMTASKQSVSTDDVVVKQQVHSRSMLELWRFGHILILLPWHRAVLGDEGGVGGACSHRTWQLGIYLGSWAVRLDVNQEDDTCVQM